MARFSHALSAAALLTLVAGCAASSPDVSERPGTDMVGVGYGTVPASQVTGSIGHLEPDGVVRSTARSIEDMIIGRVAGVVRGPGTGRLQIRGATSRYGSNEPLYVVDGAVLPTLVGVNPSDVESINVLKDGAATAMYGSRGANGVILITTTLGDR